MPGPEGPDASMDIGKTQCSQTHRVTMNSRYEIRNGSNIVAYVNEGNAGYTITPVKLNGDNLNALMRAIDHGRLPEGFTKRHTNLY